MIDHYRFKFPFKEQYLQRCSDDKLGQGMGKAFLMVKLTELGLHKLGSTIVLDDDGQYQIDRLYVPYESLSSSYSTMAVKVFDDGGYGDPYVEIKASPAKLMQGHNVYGIDDIELTAKAMIGLFYDSMPQLKQYLNTNNIQVGHIDITYSSKVSNPSVIPDVIDYLSRIRNGQTKPTANAHYENTAYFGGKQSKLQNLKCYGKHIEMLTQSKEFQAKANKGCTHSQFIIDTVYTPQLLAYAKSLLRWELRIKALKLERLGLPTRLQDLIQYQKENPKFLQELWQQAFNPIFQTFEGQVMPHYTDDEIFDMLKAKLVTYNKYGKPSFTKAQNAMRLYESISIHGYLKAKERYSDRTFYRHFKSLIDCGISKAWLQNMHVSQKKTIPLMGFTHIDFVNQLPSYYQIPEDQYPDLHLLAS